MLSLPELKSDQHGYEQYYQTLTVRRAHHPVCPNASPYLSPCDTAKFSVSIVVFFCLILSELQLYLLCYHRNDITLLLKLLAIPTAYKDLLGRVKHIAYHQTRCR